MRHWARPPAQVVKDGYGIGYGMDTNHLRFVVSSYLQVKPFLGALDEALGEMRKALLETPPPVEAEGPRKRR